MNTNENSDPKPSPTAPFTEIFDWHFNRSIAEGVDSEDAEILAEGFATRYAR